MKWNYFSSRHANGEHDGVGAFVKRALAHKQLKENSEKFTCATDVVSFLHLNLSNGDQPSYSSKERNIKGCFGR